MERDLGFTANLFDYQFSKLEHGELTRVAEIERAGQALTFHEAHEALNEIIDIAEAARLAAIAVDGEIVATQSLDDEVRYHAAIIGEHARTVGVEDADDAN